MAKVVSMLTRSLSVAASSGQQSILNYIRFLPLDGRRAILLVVTGGGEVSNAIIKIPDDSSFDEIQLLADKLNHFLHGRIWRVWMKSLLCLSKKTWKEIYPLIYIFLQLCRRQ